MSTTQPWSGLKDVPCTAWLRTSAADLPAQQERGLCTACARGCQQLAGCHAAVSGLVLQASRALAAAALCRAAKSRTCAAGSRLLRPLSPGHARPAPMPPQAHIQGTRP